MKTDTFSNASSISFDMGLSISDVLSTLPNPNCSFVTLWGLFLSVRCSSSSVDSLIACCFIILVHEFSCKILL